MLTKVVSPGRVIAFFVTLAGVYYAWGAVFTPGGTGSNVVLGLLMALAALYLVTTNLGAFLDDAFFTKGDREEAEHLRFADALLDEAEHAVSRSARGKSPKLDEKDQGILRDAAEALRQAMADVRAVPADAKPTQAQSEALKTRAERLDKELTGLLGHGRKTSVFGQLRSLGVAFAIALALRAFVVEPFQIPSSSMIPTLLIGDHLFVARFWYGLSLPFVKDPKYLARWSVPEPGDVIVFTAPPWVGPNAGEDWIKRVIAKEGQAVKMRDGVLYVDDQPYELVGTGEDARYQDYDDATNRWHTSRARHQRERLPSGREHDIYIEHSTTLEWPSFIPGTRAMMPGLDCTASECRVKDGYVFVMGDNRDNSSDGRVWGAVPIDNVKGRALFIWMSVDGSERSVALGRFTLPAFRWGRVFDGIE